MRLRPMRSAAKNSLALKPALALDAAQDALMHGLIEPRHRRHDGRPHLEHVGGQRLDPLGEIDLGAERDREHHAAGVLVGMRQRQERQEDLVAEADGLEQAEGAVAIGEDVAVAWSSRPWARRRCPRCR